MVAPSSLTPKEHEAVKLAASKGCPLCKAIIQRKPIVGDTMGTNIFPAQSKKWHAELEARS